MRRSDEFKALRADLANRRLAIRAALQGDLEALQDLGAAGSDPADAALGISQEEVTSQMAEVGIRELDRIEEAISRMLAGDYGACAGCSEEIPLDRLHALPYATLCIECQVRLEKNGFKDWSELSDDTYDSL